MIRRSLLSVAGLSLIIGMAAPAEAQLASTPSIGNGVRITRHHDGDRRHHHRRGDRGNVFVNYWDNGEWALYNNRSWEPESYNDWWHERPERNMPRWVLTNQNCERQYWSGGGWRC